MGPGEHPRSQLALALDLESLEERVVHLLLTALLSEGHVLLEGVPGTAKTLIARTFAATLDLAFGRIQFTPDLMPGDVLGTNLFNFQSGEFALTRGPIFTDVLLADEINRTPPKTQAALLQGMQERAVSIDGGTLTEREIHHDFLVRGAVDHARGVRGAHGAGRGHPRGVVPA